MKDQQIIKHFDVGDVFYLVYDETDENHCVLLGEYYTKKEAFLAAKHHQSFFPDSVIGFYEMIKED